MMTKYALMFLLLTGCGRQVPTSTEAVKPEDSAPIIAPVITPVDPADLINNEWPDGTRDWTGFGPR